jgi:hypothetical protein
MRFQKKYSNPREQAAFETGVKAGISDAKIMQEEFQKAFPHEDTKRLEWITDNQSNFVLVNEGQGSWSYRMNGSIKGYFSSWRLAIDDAMNETKRAAPLKTLIP